MEVEARLANVVKRIAEGVSGQTKGKLTRRHTERFLYTFANEVGCDFPSEDTVKGIQTLLADDHGEVKAERFEKLIEVCLKIQEESFRTPIGGIFERVVMALNQSLYYDKIESVYQSLQP